MNCANHPDRERSAFCQNCGKPLCTECVRTVGTSVFCEPCLAARVAGTQPPVYGYNPAASAYPPAIAPSGEPNPGLAALLGFIPGVGAMYNEQYAKGIVHLMVFAVLISLASDVNGIFGLFAAGWVCYMVIEAHHTARARRDGTPLPNPFGLNDLSERLGFGKAWPSGVPPAAPPYASPYDSPPNPPDPAAPQAGPYSPPANPYASPSSPYGASYNPGYVPPAAHWAVPPEASPYGPPVPPVPPVPSYPDPSQPIYRRFPSGAIWLIVLGLFFLVGNVRAFHIFHGVLFMPLLLIGVGVWIFVRKMTCTGQGLENDGTAFYHWRLMRAANAAVWVVLVGVIWLLDALHILSWGRSWPLYLIVGGIVLFLRRTVAPGYGYGYTPPTAAPPVSPVPSTDLVPRGPQPGDDPHNREEGR